MQGTLLLTYVVILVLALGALVGWAGFRLQSGKVAQARQETEMQAVLAAVTIDQPAKLRDEHFLESLAEGYARTVKGSIAILDGNLGVIGGAEYEIEDHENKARDDGDKEDRESHDSKQSDDGEKTSAFPPGYLQEAQARLDPAHPSVASWTSGPAMLAAAPILATPGGRASGYVLLSIPTGPVDGAIRRDWLLLLAGAGAVLLAVAAASLLVARRISRPVRLVTAAAEAMAGGDLSQRVAPSGPAELSGLGESFNQMADRVQDTLARQRAFVGDAAHELRTPLTSLKLRAEMLERHGEGDPKLRARYLAEVSRDIDSLQRLADRLLSLSRMDSGQPLRLKPMDLAPLLYEVAEEMGPLFAGASLAFRVDVPPHLAEAEIDAEAMRMALRNLLDNAIQYTPSGGTVTLRARNDGDSILISVADTGQGIPAEALPKLFTRFYRVDKARSRRQGGAGLGLSLVKAIAEGHGGTATAQSKVGEGSTFMIRLPRK